MSAVNGFNTRAELPLRTIDDNMALARLALLSAIVSLLLAVIYAVQYGRHELRIRRLGGIRAPTMARTPVGGKLIPLITIQWASGAVRAISKHQLRQYFEEFNQKYSKPGRNIVEFNFGARQRWIITQEPEHVKTILTSKFHDFGKGPDLYKKWIPFLGDSIFTTDGQMWHDSRSLIRPMFVKSRVSDLEIFEHWTMTLSSMIPDSGQPVDIMNLFYRLTLDVTSEFLLGTSTNSLGNPRSDFADAFHEVQRNQMMIMFAGPFSGLLPKGKYFHSIGVINEFVMPFIKAALALTDLEIEKLSGSEKHFTFLHGLIRYTRDPKMIRDQLLTVLFAGRDTTAATLSWAFYELSNYPAKYGRLRQEILDTVGRDKAPTYDHLKNMSYLRYVLNETLRLYPAVPYNMRTALRDTTIDGAPGEPPISVVEGDAVLYSPLIMHRRQGIYPPVSDKFADPSTFSPERWESWQPKAWQYLPFNGGPRICVGQNFALTEMAYVMTRLLQKYERIEYVGDWSAQEYVSELVARPSQGVNIRLFEDRSTKAGGSLI
ncbi:cytochrome P450 alkane hydroxylase [Xylariaceae sp. FL0016]|nr:cytochrome P450 alkane hydroxylase [Xylariaceae sp. FL0016]